jgi:ribosomal protein S18 acetylase RimI-like enzyme
MHGRGGVGGVATRLDFRGLGIASEVMREAVREMRDKHGVDFGLVFCEPRHAPLYKRLGWRFFEGEVFVEQPRQGRVRFRVTDYHDGHMRNRRVTIGYIIDPAFHQKGIATEAVSAMLDFCFSELRLHRVQAFIHLDNIASRKLVEKLGFRSEGLLRGNLRVGGAWRDEILFALLETDWRR